MDDSFVRLTGSQPLCRTNSGDLKPLSWIHRLTEFRRPVVARSLWELAVTFVPFVALSLLGMLAVHFGIWLGLVLVLPSAAFLLRLFAIQHDCGHGAFFANRSADDWTGRILGVLTFTPYDDWRRSHATHHATAGNLDRRGTGDIATLTVAEFRALPAWRRFAYQLYRHPVVLFCLAPAWLFLVQQRLPDGLMKAGAAPWISALATNGAMAVVYGLLIWWLGVPSVLLVQLPAVLLAGAAGIWLFYVQHQFPATQWARAQGWDFQEAALHGSSYYVMPAPLQWITANIGMHHVHHLASKIPYYRLPEVLRRYPELAALGRITIGDSVRTVRLALWDEANARLVSFREAAVRTDAGTRE